MSHKKEILDLESQAGGHEARARELRKKAQELSYLDRLEELGISDREIVEYSRGQRVRVGWIDSHGYLCGTRIKKDGSEGVKIQLWRNEIKKIEKPK